MSPERLIAWKVEAPDHAAENARLAVRHRRLLVPDRQPLRSASALPARESSPDVLKQHVLAVPIRQRLLVQQDAPVAVPAEGRQGEGVVVSQGARVKPILS